MYKSPLAYSRKYQLWQNIDNDDDHDVLLFNVNWVVFQLNSFAPCRLILVEGLSAEVLDCYMEKRGFDSNYCLETVHQWPLLVLVNYCSLRPVAGFFFVILFCKYSQTSIKRSSLRQRKVAFQDRRSLKRGSIHMKFSMMGHEKGVILTQVTA